MLGQKPYQPRDPHKYDWMPPDPPRVPHFSYSNLEMGMVCIVGLLMIGVAAWLVLGWKLLERLIGWLWMGPN